jgi:hypothetical protein
MAETTIEKAVCENCGVAVRENTVFCYNCGGRVADLPEPVSPADNVAGEPDGKETSDETRAALDDLAQKLKEDDAQGSDKLAAAAAERRKARIRPRKKKEIVWEPIDEAPDRLFILITLLICIIAAAIVFLTVYWK